MDIKKEAVKLHEKLRGKVELRPKVSVNQRVLSLLYTPGVAEIVRRISERHDDVYTYTGKGNAIAIVSDGSRILGLGNLGPEAALPVMEGKALLFKVYGNVDAFPLCVKAHRAEEIISFVEAITPTFGAINIEDIEAPKCFVVVQELMRSLKIPVFHDDQHGTAIVVAAALLNALKLVGKNLRTAKIVILGAGAAGYGITKLLVHAGATNIYVFDSKGILSTHRTDLNPYKAELASLTHHGYERGDLASTIAGSDVFIGVSGKANILTSAHVTSMAKRAIVFALSNPDPEIMPGDAKKGGAEIIATGRSDFGNQVNNVVVFPFLMRKILDERIQKVTPELMLTAARKIASFTKPLANEHILPTADEMKPL